MIRFWILVIGAVASALMGLLDYMAVIAVSPNWFDWLPFLGSLGLVLISFAPELIGDLIEGIADAIN